MSQLRKSSNAARADGGLRVHEAFERKSTHAVNAHHERDAPRAEFSR